MKTLTKAQLTSIAGGNPAVAVAAGIGVVTGTAAVIESVKTFVELGHDLGEAVYNKLHPESPLGKMEYKKEDYSKAYLDYKYPSHAHPNNVSGNGFHNSFGGF